MEVEKGHVPLNVGVEISSRRGLAGVGIKERERERDGWEI